MNDRKRSVAIWLVLLLSVAMLSTLVACGDKEPAATTVKNDPSTTFTYTDDKEGLDWPKDKMGGLPELDATIQAAVDSGNGYVISFVELSKQDAEDYVKDLKKEGFEASLDSTTSDAIMFYGTNDDDALVMFVYDVAGETGTLTYAEEG